MYLQLELCIYRMQAYRHSCRIKTGDTAIAVGHIRWMLIALLHLMNLLPIAPFNRLSNGASHIQINATVSEIQRWERNAIARMCTEVVVQSVNMY